MPEPQADDSTSKSSPQSSARPRKRLNLDLTPEAYELLQRLADESGKNMAEVLRTGLALYGVAWDEKNEGNKLAIAKDGKIEKEIIIP